MAWLGLQLKEERAQCTDNVSCKTCTVRRTARRPHFFPSSLRKLWTLDVGKLGYIDL